MFQGGRVRHKGVRSIAGSVWLRGSTRPRPAGRTRWSGNDRSMMARASASEAAAPVASICTAMLPSAVASTGPATTGSPVASAVNWLSSRFCEPPPMTRIRAIGRPTSDSRSRMTSRYFSARLSKTARAYAPGVAGAGWSVLRQKRSIALRHVVGIRERRIVRIDQVPKPRLARRRVHQLAIGELLAAGRPRSPAPLEHPQPHHVLQQPRRAFHAAFVREVQVHRARRQDRRVDLHADERPGARS